MKLLKRWRHHRFSNLMQIFLVLNLSISILVVDCAPPKKGGSKVGKMTAGKKRRPAYKYPTNSNFNNQHTGQGGFNQSDFYWNSDELKLRGHLFENYSADIRPVINSSKVTDVNISLTVIQIIDLNEQDQFMITNAQIALKWHDEHLVWKPEDFNNQSRIVVSSREIWTPDIVLFNSADVAYSTQRDNYLIDVKHDGLVMWMFPDTLRSYCKVDIKYFPFDRHNCSLELQSWSRSKKEVIVNYDNEKPVQSHSFIDTEWNLLNITYNAAEQNDFVWVEYMLHLKRNHAFFVNHMIFPFAILSSLTLFVFWLPPDSGEKITLTITILLSLTVFLQFITEYTPRAAKSLPVIGLYFNVNLILVLISVILTIIVLNFHFRGPKKQRVPRWMRKYIIGYLGRAFCFCQESRAFCLVQEECFGVGSNKSTKTDKYPTSQEKELQFEKKDYHKPSCLGVKTSKSDDSNQSNANVDNEIDYLNSQSEPAYIKCSASHSRQKQQQEQKQSSTILTNSLDKINTSASNSSLKPDLLERKSSRPNGRLVGPAESSAFSAAPFNEEVSKNLEKMLIKIQKSFDPFKLQDENLKFAILKEILECQRLLLAANLLNKKEKHITLNEIYDEWKILAMIVDRICFFFYLTALMLSSGLFFIRERLYNDNY